MLTLRAPVDYPRKRGRSRAKQQIAYLIIGAIPDRAWRSRRFDGVAGFIINWR